MTDAHIHAAALRTAFLRLPDLPVEDTVLFELPRDLEQRARTIQHLMWVANLMWGQVACIASVTETTITLRRSPVAMPANLLTRPEIALCLKLGECWNDFLALPGVEADHPDEVAAAIHSVQRAVMSRPAKRAHPEIFR